MRRPALQFIGNDAVGDPSYTCPHCGVLQALTAIRGYYQSATVIIKQCVNCKDISLDIKLYKQVNSTSFEDNEIILHPKKTKRRAKSFSYAPQEVSNAYNDACYLFPIHIGASGAYARRAIELILDHAGYAAKTLADSIQMAQKEIDSDKRLSKGLLIQLNYIKEIGNFALHVRRDDELVIIDISDSEVAACLEIVEELIEQLFEVPAAEYQRILLLNEKLKAAGKKEIELPSLPQGLISGAVGEAGEE